MNKNSPEIDLSEVFARIGRAFSSLGNNIQKLVSYILLNKGYFSIFIAIGICLAVLVYNNKSKEYYSKITLKSYILSNEHCLDLVETLEELVEEKNYSELSNLLNIDTAYTNKLVEISYKSFEFDFNPERDTIMEGDPFYIQVSVYDNKVLDSLQKGLVQYLENNNYALKRKSIKQQNLKELSLRIGNQIDELDTLKKVIEGNLATAGSSEGILFLQQPIDPINTYREVISLYREQMDIRKELLLTTSVEVIQGFTKFSDPHKPDLIYLLFVCVSGMFFLGLILSPKIIKDKKAVAKKDNAKKYKDPFKEKFLIEQ